MRKNLKQLLLKDLCSRLPYGVKCRQHKLDSQICTLCPEYLKDFDAVEEFEPYLRPMSSMTKKEKKQFNNFICIDYDAFFEKENGHINQAKIMSDGIDWLLKNHFDFRNLIECKLAIEITEENNPYKNDI